MKGLTCVIISRCLTDSEPYVYFRRDTRDRKLNAALETRVRRERQIEREEKITFICYNSRKKQRDGDKVRDGDREDSSKGREREQEQGKMERVIRKEEMVRPERRERQKERTACKVRRRKERDG